jgi:hypothetical protein
MGRAGCCKGAPVTLPITLLIAAEPLKLALSPVARPNCPKLWKRLLPTCLRRPARSSS